MAEASRATLFQASFCRILRLEGFNAGEDEFIQAELRIVALSLTVGSKCLMPQSEVGKSLSGLAALLACADLRPRCVPLNAFYVKYGS